MKTKAYYTVNKLNNCKHCGVSILPSWKYCDNKKCTSERLKIDQERFRNLRKQRENTNKK